MKVRGYGVGYNEASSQPLPRKSLHEARCLGIGEHAIHARDELSLLPQRAGRGRLQQGVVRRAAPQKVREAARELERIELTDPARRVQRIGLDPIEELQAR